MQKPTTTNIILLIIICVLLIMDLLTSQNNQTNIISPLRKSVRMSNQHKYLVNCRYQKTIPSGIRDQTRFTSSLDDPNFQSICQNLMNFSASRLLDLFIVSNHKTSVINTTI